MRLLTYTSRTHKASGLLGTYQLVSFAGLNSHTDLNALSTVYSSGSVTPVADCWNTDLRWTTLRQVYSLISNAGNSRVSGILLRRTLFRLGTSTGFSFTCRRGIGYRSTAGIVGLSLRSIFGFSRQLFNTPRLLNATSLFVKKSNTYRLGASYNRLAKSRTRFWIDLRNRNFSKARVNRKDSTQALRAGLLSTRRFRTIAWWASSLFYSRGTSPTTWVSKSLRPLVPTKNTNVSGIPYISNIFSVNVLLHGHHQRFTKRMVITPRNRRTYSAPRGSYNFTQARAESRLRVFPNYWRKTRRVAPLKSQRNDWIYRETGYNSQGGLGPRTFSVGQTFDGSTAHLKYLLNGNTTIGIRAIDEELGAIRQSRLAKNLARTRFTLRRLFTKDAIRQLPQEMSRYYRQLVWTGFRGRPWMRYRRADSKSRAVFRRMRRIFSICAPRFRYSKLNKLYMVRYRINIRSNQFHRRALFYRLRRRWATQFGLNRNTGIFVSAMDGAAKVIYSLMGKPVASLFGVSNYLKTANNTRLDRYKTNGSRNNAAAYRRRLRTLAMLYLQKRGADCSLEGLLVSGFAYDVAFKQNRIGSALETAPYRISMHQSLINNRFLMGNQSVFGAAAYKYSRERVAVTKSISIWRNLPVMYRRRLGFIDKFLAYAIIRGGASTVSSMSSTSPSSVIKSVVSKLAVKRVTRYSTVAICKLRNAVSSVIINNMFSGSAVGNVDSRTLSNKQGGLDIYERARARRDNPGYLLSPSLLNRHTRWRLCVLGYNRKGEVRNIKYPLFGFSRNSLIQSSLQKRSLGLITTFSSVRSAYWNAALGYILGHVESAHTAIREGLKVVSLSTPKSYAKGGIVSDLGLVTFKKAVQPSVQKKREEKVTAVRFGKGTPVGYQYVTRSRIPALPHVPSSSTVSLSFLKSNKDVSAGYSAAVQTARVLGVVSLEAFYQGFHNQIIQNNLICQWVESKTSKLFNTFRVVDKTSKSYLAAVFVNSPDMGRYVTEKAYGRGLRLTSRVMIKRWYTTDYGFRIPHRFYFINRRFTPFGRKNPLYTGFISAYTLYRGTNGQTAGSGDLASSFLQNQTVSRTTIDQFTHFRLLKKRKSRIFRRPARGSYFRNRRQSTYLRARHEGVYGGSLVPFYLDQLSSEQVYSYSNAISNTNQLPGQLSNLASRFVPLQYSKSVLRDLAHTEIFKRTTEAYCARQGKLNLYNKHENYTMKQMRKRVAVMTETPLIGLGLEQIDHNKYFFSFKAQGLDKPLRTYEPGVLVRALFNRNIRTLLAAYGSFKHATREANKPFSSVLGGKDNIILRLASSRNVKPTAAGVDSKVVKKRSYDLIRALVSKLPTRSGYNKAAQKNARMRQYRLSRERRRKALALAPEYIKPWEMVLESPESEKPTALVKRDAPYVASSSDEEDGLIAFVRYKPTKTQPVVRRNTRPRKRF